MNEVTKEKLIFIRDNVFGPNSSVYECMTDDELVESYCDFIKDDGYDGKHWWEESYHTKNGLFAWGRFQLELEAEFWAREEVDSKEFLKGIMRRWNAFKKMEEKYFVE